MLPRERRHHDRKCADMLICKSQGETGELCRMDDISPSGVRLSHSGNDADLRETCDLEIHLVPNKLTTMLKARLVWRNASSEAFEFIGATPSQRALLEKLLASR